MLPGLYALQTRRYLAEFGVTADQLAARGGHEQAERAGQSADPSPRRHAHPPRRCLLPG
jgi:hypothetical protein